MKVPLLDLSAQFKTIESEVRAAIDGVLASQRFILGPEVEGLEQEVAAYSHCRYGVGVSSGTDALLIALMALGIESGDEVITTPYTFFATAGSIARLGAKPVFVDIDAETYNISPGAIDSQLSERTKAIIPVHLYGQVAEMNPIMEIARKQNIYVIEDAAQAIGAEYRGKRAGSLGHLGCFSFFPSKNLGCLGDGGMVVTNDADLADRLKLLRNHGYRPKYVNKVVGGNFRLDALQAAVLRVKLKYLEDWTERRQKNAARYRELFTEAGIAASATEPLRATDRVALPVDAGQGRHIYNQFVIRTKPRDALREHLKEQQIGSEIYYPVPMHLQQCFSSLGHKPGDFPVSERAAAETLALPIYPELSDEMLAHVVQTIAAFFKDGVTPS